jgi:hypothetical protein
MCFNANDTDNTNDTAFLYVSSTVFNKATTYMKTFIVGQTTVSWLILYANCFTEDTILYLLAVVTLQRIQYRDHAPLVFGHGLTGSCQLARRLSKSEMLFSLIYSIRRVSVITLSCCHFCFFWSYHGLQSFI